MFLFARISTTSNILAFYIMVTLKSIIEENHKSALSKQSET